MRRADDQRIAETESLFREVNERIAETVTRLGSSELEIVCECGRAECVERLPTTLGEYERVRADGTQFLLAPGHEDDSHERVVRRTGPGSYQVVEKVKPRIAALVRRLDPRRATPS